MFSNATDPQPSLRLLDVLEIRLLCSALCRVLLSRLRILRFRLSYSGVGVEGFRTLNGLRGCVSRFGSWVSSGVDSQVIRRFAKLACIITCDIGFHAILRMFSAFSTSQPVALPVQFRPELSKGAERRRIIRRAFYLKVATPKEVKAFCACLLGLVHLVVQAKP